MARKKKKPALSEKPANLPKWCHGKECTRFEFFGCPCVKTACRFQIGIVGYVQLKEEEDNEAHQRRGSQ